MGSGSSVLTELSGSSRPGSRSLTVSAFCPMEPWSLNETRGSRIHAFTVESDGSLGAPSLFADLGPERQPDGLCVDIEGGVWVGCVTSGEFLRVVAGGTVTHRVRSSAAGRSLPPSAASDGRTLYMVVDDTTIEGITKGESTGWIMQARVDVPAAGSP